MTLVELQKALREGKAVTRTNDGNYFRIEDGQFASRDCDTGELIHARDYFLLNAGDFLNDDTGYELFSNFSNKPILPESERKYLADVIRPFRDKLKVTIEKFRQDDGDEFISINVRNDDDTYYHDIDLAPFAPKEMYRGMELYKEYSLEDLGL